jgi:hypothetical protein
MHSHIGTGILIATENRAYLLSARHVIQDKNGNITNASTSIAYHKDNYVYPINGNFTFYSVDDKLDIFVCELTEDTKNDLLNNVKYFPSYMMLEGHNVQSVNEYYIGGYPESKVKLQYPLSEKIIKREFLTIKSSMISSDKINYKLEFHRRKMKNLQTYKKVMTPDPRGMSGGGLWYRLGDNLFLIGIVHTYNHTHSYIEAIKIDYVIDILNRKFNDSYEY